MGGEPSEVGVVVALAEVELGVGGELAAGADGGRRETGEVLAMVA